jgi:CHAD domain-containing protein
LTEATPDPLPRTAGARQQRAADKPSPAAQQPPASPGRQASRSRPASSPGPASPSPAAPRAARPAAAGPKLVRGLRLAPDPEPAAAAGDAAPQAGLQLPAGSGFRLDARSGRMTVRRTWLDTFDWRLYRAGLTLEQVARPGSAAVELRLTGRDGALIAAEPMRSGRDGTLPRWPALAGALPAGPLAERLAQAAGIRALLPVARATSVRYEQRALNGDDKTIARVTTDEMSVTFPAAAGLPARLEVSPVRGYQAQADRLAGALAALPGAVVAGPPPLEQVLAAAGRRAGDYTGKIEVELAGSMPAPAALAAVFSSLLDTIEANVPGTIADTDTEFLHDLRVAVRRTRSALKLAGKALPPAVRDRFRAEFKWLGDLTTPTRDLDVYLLELPAMTRELAGGEPPDLEPFGDLLRRRRVQARRDLVRGLRSARFTGLCRDWRQALEQAAAGARRRPAAAGLAASSIEAAHRKVLAGGAAITPDSPPELLHDLRKRGKELRYALEVFASLQAPDAQWRAVRELKGLQDCLGEFQDTEVQRAELRAFADQMMAEQSAPAATLLAMGEVAAGLARRQRQARLDFADLFREFARPAGQARIRGLTRQAAS